MDLSRHSLYPHQVAAIQFLALRGKAVLADVMGLGKTRQAVVAMNETAPTGANAASTKSTRRMVIVYII